MLKIENVDVHGWEAAIRGARNPMNSWDKTDSDYGCENRRCLECGFDHNWCGNRPVFVIGPNDHKLLRNLANAGPDHGKYLRMITVTLDINAPLYWWKEFDTYKVGTVANSCSTMHKIHAQKFTLDDFSHEHLRLTNLDGELHNGCLSTLENVIDVLNTMRTQYVITKNKFYWWQMIQLLPTSYNQRRTVFLSYAVLRTMYHARKNHKLDEWHVFCDFIRSLPYSELITGEVSADA